jgi:DNA repair protein RadA/Sms
VNATLVTMAKRSTTTYVCNNCGAETPTWSGKCYGCDQWNTLEEQVSQKEVAKVAASGQRLNPIAIGTAVKKDSKRLQTGLKDVDDVLGGGAVVGSVVLVAGQPGIGKSTLLLQLANMVSKSARVLYISGEESTHQVGLRAERLKAQSKSLQLASSSITDDIASTIGSGNYDLVVVDSIQTIACNAINSAPGNVSQITNSTNMIVAAAKSSDTAVLLVGHVTKEGSIAGPKVLEHIVDVVLQIEGDRYGGFKLLRAIKNRFGSTNETAIFEMNEDGMVPVVNPSASLLEERQVSDGSIVLATMQGTRPLLVEVQALVNKTNYGYPKRATSGVDLNRINLLIAMLERRTKLNLGDKDIYINIVGGIRLTEPAADLAIAMAIASAAKGMQLKKNSVVFGELGLSGEVRHVPLIEKRIKESEKLGFEGAIGPKIKSGKKSQNYSPVGSIREALNSLLEK